MMTDPIADMLTRIRNGFHARKERVDVPYSKMKEAIALLLKQEGYLQDVQKKNDSRPMLEITLKYHRGRSAIVEMKRESTPGHRVYRKANDLPVVLNGYGIAIVSTPRGLMTGKEAKKAGVGGEIICSVS